MSENWAYNLDLLAMNNVIDYDAASFITGQKPRYVGRPAMPPSPYVGQPPKAPAINQPEIDEFKREKAQLPENEDKNESFIKNPSWKKWLFGALALGGIVLAGFKYKSILNWFKGGCGLKGLKNKFDWQKTKDFVKDKFDKTRDFFKDGWQKVKGWFKRKP